VFVPFLYCDLKCSSCVTFPVDSHVGYARLIKLRIKTNLLMRLVVWWNPISPKSKSETITRRWNDRHELLKRGKCDKRILFQIFFICEAVLCYGIWLVSILHSVFLALLVGFL